MKRHFLIIFTVIILIPFAACKKYEEGPRISLRSKKERLIGHWAVKTYLINNIDSTQLFKEKLGILFYIATSQEGVYAVVYNTLHSVGGLINLHGHWDFINKKEELVFDIEQTFPNYSVVHDTIISFGPFSTYESSIWTIKKLKQKELIIENQTNDKIYRLEFELSSDR